MVRTLYLARIDPYLTSGCALDPLASDAAIEPLRSVQHTAIRRMLHLHPRSCIIPLYTETGIWPIAYRRALLAVRFLAYLAVDCPALLPASTFAEACALTRSGYRTWLSDLQSALSALPVPVTLDVSAGGSVTQQTVQDLRRKIEDSLRDYLVQEIHKSQRLVLLRLFELHKLNLAQTGEYLNLLGVALVC